MVPAMLIGAAGAVFAIILPVAARWRLPRFLNSPADRPFWRWYFRLVGKGLMYGRFDLLNLLLCRCDGVKVECPQHGEQATCFVCQHMVEGLRQGRSVGFFWSGEDDSPHPDAWCSDCEARVRKTDGEWVGEAAEKLGAKILCAKCYELAKALTYPK
jgi:hypothetical protein